MLVRIYAYGIVGKARWAHLSTCHHNKPEPLGEGLIWWRVLISAQLVVPNDAVCIFWNRKRQKLTEQWSVFGVRDGLISPYVSEWKPTARVREMAKKERWNNMWQWSHHLPGWWDGPWRYSRRCRTRIGTLWCSPCDITLSKAQCWPPTCSTLCQISSLPGAVDLKHIWNI